MATIYDLIMDPKFAPLRAQGDTAAHRTIAASLNARQETTSPNPIDTPAIVLAGTPTIADISTMITGPEYVQLSDPDLRINAIANAIGTAEAAEAVRALSLWLQSLGHRVSSVYQVAEIILEHRDVARLVGLMSLLAQAEMLSPESAAALQAGLLQPDPTWAAEITEFGTSPAQSVGYEWITPDNVRAYLAEIAAGATNNQEPA